MPEGEPEIAICQACGTRMDVSGVGTFTNVECPTCRQATRVKRDFGPYTLLRRHAVGGMSMVFVARDKTLDREVVVKILSEEYSADDKRIAAFEEEARITASFSHPHVVRVFTTGRAFGRFYIAMELVPGGHFEQHIQERGMIPEAEALPLAIEVAEGLKAAHSAGLIHRDVKPGNILLDSKGGAKIVDFGLALVTKGGKARAAEIWATPYYVPPETIDGLEEDFRSDIYAFGATFYHALAGVPPCDEEAMDTRRLRESKRKIPPLDKVAAGVSRETCEVIRRAMEYEPENRFRSYDDLIGALKAAKQRLESGALAGEGPNGARGRRRGTDGRRNRVMILGAGLASLAALLFAAASIRSSKNLPAEGAGALEVESGPGVVVNPLPVEDSGGGIRVARTYRAAGEALRAGDHQEAARLFGEVRDDEEVMEPTGSWAACEAVIAAYLEGKPEAGRRLAERARSHVRSAGSLPPESAVLLVLALDRMMELPPVEVPGEFEGRGASYLAWMMAGLKNWEQGVPERAEGFFKAVAGADGSEAWLAPYSDIAKDYLDDLERLRAAEPESFEPGEEECRRKLDELEKLEPALKTRGRAKFNVGVWRTDLEHRLAGLAAERTQEVASSSGRPEGIEEDFEALRFGKALEELRAWKPADDEETRERRVLVSLAEAALVFLSDLEDACAGGVEGVPVECRDGRSFDAVAGAAGGRVMLVKAGAEAVPVEWSELDPGSVIDLHRSLVRGERIEIERLRRHEQAVVFDLLAGDGTRAREAAGNLAAESETFRQRWEEFLSVIGR